MSQIFHRSTNTLSRLTIYGFLFVVGALTWRAAEVQRSSYVTTQGEAKVQKPPFSHAHHVGGMGLDCRYCHTGVGTSPVPRLPPPQNCMNCHANRLVSTPAWQIRRAHVRNPGTF